MIQGLAAGLGGGGYSASSGASSGPVGYTPTFGGFGGINTGTQGLSTLTLALIAGAVVLALLVLKR